MNRTPLFVGLLFAMGLAAASGAARADVPGPRDTCEFDEKVCSLCWEPYGKPPEGDPDFKACSDGAVAKGYKESCRARQGGGDNVVFCAKPADAQKVTGGCGGCSLGEGSAGSALLAVAAASALLVSRRRKAPRRG